MATDSRTARLRHELLQGVAEHVQLHGEGFGMPPDTAEQLGWLVADFLAEEWGGQQLTFPKEHKYHLTERDMEIYAKFNGSNMSELSREYGLAVRTLYRVIKRARKVWLDDHQNDLFNS